MTLLFFIREKTAEKTRMKTGEEEEETRNTTSIPHEIIFEVLTRLPVKSLSRFRSVSKVWNSTISDFHFVISHQNRTFTRSDATTLILTFPDQFNIKRLIFSTTHHQEQYPVAIHCLTLSGFVAPYVSDSLNGLICLDIGKGIKICNPITREFITLPPTKTETPYSPSFSYYRMFSFGFDPVSNLHKVLNTWVISTGDGENEMLMEHRIFTLGAYSWRRIGDGPSHFPRVDGVCIDGVIYYRGWTSMKNPQGSEILVAFDVRVENFRFIQIPNWALFDSILIQWQGHLGIVDYQHLKDGNIMEIWVLENSMKEVWVKKSIVLESNWRDIGEDWDFFLAGTIHTGEIILAPRSLKKPFYVVYVDMERKRVRKVEIQGLPDYELRFCEAYINISATGHVESILSLSDLNY